MSGDPSFFICPPKNWKTFFADSFECSRIKRLVNQHWFNHTIASCIGAEKESYAIFCNLKPWSSFLFFRDVSSCGSLFQNNPVSSALKTCSGAYPFSSIIFFSWAGKSFADERSADADSREVLTL